MTDNWLRIVAKLKEMRLAAPGFSDYTTFKEASGINRATVEATEKRLNRPSLDIIERWVTACGSTLGAFFADLEGLPIGGKTSKDSMKIPIKKANRAAHEKLEAVLNGGGNAANWLHGNVETFHEAFVRKPRK